MLATHAVLELVGRPVPPGMCALHACDNPPCVNPAHLWIGTRAQNAADMKAKGRARSGYGGGPPCGERNHKAKLNTCKVQEIRRRFAAGEPSSKLAQEYGVARNTIRAVTKRQLWKHVVEVTT
jgi:hypothetical protein